MKRTTYIILVVAAIIGGFFYLRYQIYFSHGDYPQSKIFEIVRGDGNALVAEKLKNEGLISGKIYFYYYLRTHNLTNKILPGKYDLSGSMTIPEIAVNITNEENILPGYAKITFPEGWSSKQIAERLKAKGLDGDGFLAIVKNPSQDLIKKYTFLTGIKNLEGYLFPDTYFFAKDISAENIISKMLNNFDNKLTENIRTEIVNQKKTISEIITMASILEGEVRSDEDRAIVSGIFWERIKIGQPLQSCATLAFILGENKKQYSINDTQIVSPYNTYRNKGLPPGPIVNPGFSAIKAAVYFTDSNYNYFLSDPATGKTIFSKTFEEHKANKAKYGL